MEVNQEIRESIDRMEDHEILRRLQSNMFSEEAEVYARYLLSSRGFNLSADNQGEEGVADDSPGMFWPVWFGLTVGTLLGAPAGAAIGGAIGAGLGAAASIWGVTLIVKRGVAWLHSLMPSKAARIATLLSLWLVSVWISGAVGFILKHAR